MKTIGERIRQAREAMKLSGDGLAKKVGYKNQSAIGNLENRAGGTGGNKIGAIAEALNVSLEWLMYGPDGDNVPFLPPRNRFNVPYTTLAMESLPPKNSAWPFVDVTPDEYERLDDEQRKDIEKYVVLQVKTREPPEKHTSPASKPTKVRSA